MTITDHRYAVILSGGSGTRLWPVSRASRPKQLLNLSGEKTLLQQTALRLSNLIKIQHLYTVTHENHKFEVMEQLSELFSQNQFKILSEPVSRNTLPAIAWAAFKIYEQDPEAVIGVFPSDHVIDNEKEFLEVWEHAEIIALEDYLVLIGIKPKSTSTGFGYIKPGRQLMQTNKKLSYEVDAFVEKPNIEKAKIFVNEGYFWNAGMFVFKAEALIRMIKELQPKIYDVFLNYKDPKFIEAYNNLPNLSIDYGIAEQAKKIAVVPLDIAWNDLGSWDSIYQENKKDEFQNVCHGDILNQDTQNSFIWSEKGFLATLGLNNIIAVQTEDALLIADRSRSQDIKYLVDKIKVNHSQLTEIHKTVFRPWGLYSTLEEEAHFKIKKITVNPGQKLSMQMHHYRSEHWVVISGEASIICNESFFKLKPNESTFIPQGHHHRLMNEGDELLMIIEVQCGSYVGEDDIVRFDDDYGRVKYE
jgi:mannose-1-phosphate guanylyltransferase/mannose-6-phosphate isomerase